MDKVILKSTDIEFLLNWRDEHKDLVRLAANPIKAIKIICVESGYTITCIRNGQEFRFAVTENGKSIGNLTFRIIENGMCELIKNKTKLSPEDRQAILTVYCSLMALFVFGNSEEHKYTEYDKIEKTSYRATKPSKKSQRKGITYILGIRGSNPQMVIKGSHSSPHHSFCVRGHYRHYKNGKVIWISEYEKGTGARKDKNYKVGTTRQYYEERIDRK